MKLTIKLFALISVVFFSSCRRDASAQQFDEIAVGWKHHEDNPTTVWLNDEPIMRLGDGGLLHDFGGFPIRRGSNSLRVFVENPKNADSEWSNLAVRYISGKPTRELALKTSDREAVAEFDAEQVRQLPTGIKPGEATDKTDESLKRWVLLFLERVEKKDIKALRKMMDGFEGLSDAEFCPWATAESKLNSRVTNVESLSCVRGKSCALVYAKSQDQKLMPLCYSISGEMELRLKYFTFVVADNGSCYMKTRLPEGFSRIHFE